VRGLDVAQEPYIGPGCQFGGPHQSGAVVAFGDGPVPVVSPSINPGVFEALSTIAGGEQLPADGTGRAFTSTRPAPERI
jgi:hypothetical protein